MPITRARSIFFSPGDDARDQLVAFIGQARRSVHINIYGFTDPEVVAALIAQHKAGRLVAICADHTQAEGKSEHPELQVVVDAGIEVVITTSPTGAIDHEKVCLIDMVDGVMADSSAVGYGSYNFSPTAQLQRNYFEIDNDPSFVGKFWADWQTSHAFGIIHHPEWQLSPTSGVPDASS